MFGGDAGSDDSDGRGGGRLMAGARQHRVPCVHLDGRPAEYAMHSAVSWANREYFKKESRVSNDVELTDIREWLEQADDRDGTVVVCNQCRRAKIVGLDGGERITLHEGGRR